MSRYTVKVKKSRSKTYLWGGDRITTRLSSSLFLTFRVEDMGEPIIFGIYKAGIGGVASEEVEIGTLMENETFTIQLNDVTGIYAQCRDSDVDTKVECFIESFLSND
ncbi:MAG: hypothetical protein ACK6BG_06140 [Cyanobacteriota bacterium]|jgi:hypothetical protein